jgi:hypothetical protein
MIRNRKLSVQHHGQNKSKQSNDTDNCAKKACRDKYRCRALVLRFGRGDADCHDEAVDYSLYKSHLSFLSLEIPDFGRPHVADLAVDCVFLRDL